MSKRIVIVGGVAGGASIAARCRRLDESAEIVMFERGPNVSFSNCSLPWHLSGVVKDAEQLVLMSPDQFDRQYHIDARVNREVVAIDRTAKQVTVKDTTTGDTSVEAYDVLCLAPGANPVRPPIPGIDGDHVFTVRNVVDIDRIARHLATVERVVVIGAGYIGLEVAENLTEGGKQVALVEAMDQVLTPLDPELAAVLHHELDRKGVDLVLSDGVAAIEADHVVLKSGRRVEAGAVIVAVGVRPESGLAEEAGLELGINGSIKVDHNYRTSDPDIYAVGDAIEVWHKVTGLPTLLALAGPAQRQARAAADHIYGRTVHARGVVGSAVVRVFDYTAASTGLNEKQCKGVGIDYDYVYVIPGDAVGLMPSSNPLFFKVLFQKGNGKLLGAQAVGKGAADKRVDVVATLLMMNGDLQDLADLELSYSPLYSTPKDVVNHAALVGLNILNCEFSQVPVTQVRELVESGAFIIDAREPNEYAAGHLTNAVNIPLSQFRQRLDEIPADRPVYVHCRSSQRSYNMVRALNQLGRPNAVNISGSYLGISEYEYFTDKQQDRTPIMTEYNFD